MEPKRPTKRLVILKSINYTNYKKDTTINSEDINDNEDEDYLGSDDANGIP